VPVFNFTTYLSVDCFSLAASGARARQLVRVNWQLKGTGTGSGHTELSPIISSRLTPACVVGAA
jgi:hypothetical protein